MIEERKKTSLTAWLKRLGVVGFCFFWLRGWCGWPCFFLRETKSSNLAIESHMKKYILPFALLLSACSNSGEKKVEPSAADVQAVEQVDNSPQAYFASTGGTSIEIISNVNGTFTVKYSVDGVAAEMDMKREPLMVNGEKNMSTGEVKLSGNNGSIVIAPSECDGGTHNCKLTVGERVMEACGKYAE